MSYKDFYSTLTNKLYRYQWSKPATDESGNLSTSTSNSSTTHPRVYNQLVTRINVLKKVQSDLVRITNETFPLIARANSNGILSKDALGSLTTSLTEKVGSVSLGKRLSISSATLAVPVGGNTRSHGKKNSLTAEQLSHPTQYHDMAIAFVDCGLDVGVEETLGAALYKVATIQQKIGDALIAMEEVLAADFIKPLTVNIETNIRFTERARADVDQALSSLNDAKNKALANENETNPESDALVEQCQKSYDDALDRASNLMKNILDSPETIQRLLELVKAQMVYHREAHQLLSDILPQINDMVSAQDALRSNIDPSDDDDEPLVRGPPARNISITNSKPNDDGDDKVDLGNGATEGVEGVKEKAIINEVTDQDKKSDISNTVISRGITQIDQSQPNSNIIPNPIPIDDIIVIANDLTPTITIPEDQPEPITMIPEAVNQKETSENPLASESTTQKEITQEEVSERGLPIPDSSTQNSFPTTQSENVLNSAPLSADDDDEYILACDPDMAPPAQSMDRGLDHLNSPAQYSSLLGLSKSSELRSSDSMDFQPKPAVDTNSIENEKDVIFIPDILKSDGPEEVSFDDSPLRLELEAVRSLEGDTADVSDIQSANSDSMPSFEDRAITHSLDDPSRTLSSDDVITPSMSQEFTSTQLAHHLSDPSLDMAETIEDVILQEVSLPTDLTDGNDLYIATRSGDGTEILSSTPYSSIDIESNSRLSRDANVTEDEQVISLEPMNVEIKNTNHFSIRQVEDDEVNELTENVTKDQTLTFISDEHSGNLNIDESALNVPQAIHFDNSKLESELTIQSHSIDEEPLTSQKSLGTLDQSSSDREALGPSSAKEFISGLTDATTTYIQHIDEPSLQVKSTEMVDGYHYEDLDKVAASIDHLQILTDLHESELEETVQYSPGVEIPSTDLERIVGFKLDDAIISPYPELSIQENLHIPRGLGSAEMNQLKFDSASDKNNQVGIEKDLESNFLNKESMDMDVEKMATNQMIEQALASHDTLSLSIPAEDRFIDTESSQDHIQQVIKNDIVTEVLNDDLDLPANQPETDELVRDLAHLTKALDPNQTNTDILVKDILDEEGLKDVAEDLVDGLKASLNTKKDDGSVSGSYYDESDADEERHEFSYLHAGSDGDDHFDDFNEAKVELNEVTMTDAETKNIEESFQSVDNDHNITRDLIEEQSVQKDSNSILEQVIDKVTDVANLAIGNNNDDTEDYVDTINSGFEDIGTHDIIEDSLEESAQDELNSESILGQAIRKLSDSANVVINENKQNEEDDEFDTTNIEPEHTINRDILEEESHKNMENKEVEDSILDQAIDKVTDIVNMVIGDTNNDEIHDTTKDQINELEEEISLSTKGENLVTDDHKDEVHSDSILGQVIDKVADIFTGEDKESDVPSQLEIKNEETLQLALDQINEVEAKVLEIDQLPMDVLTASIVEDGADSNIDPHVINSDSLALPINSRDVADLSSDVVSQEEVQNSEEEQENGFFSQSETNQWVAHALLDQIDGVAGAQSNEVDSDDLSLDEEIQESSRSFLKKLERSGLPPLKDDDDVEELEDSISKDESDLPFLKGTEDFGSASEDDDVEELEDPILKEEILGESDLNSKELHFPPLEDDDDVEELEDPILKVESDLPYLKDTEDFDSAASEDDDVEELEDPILKKEILNESDLNSKELHFPPLEDDDDVEELEDPILKVESDLPILKDAEGFSSGVSEDDDVVELEDPILKKKILGESDLKSKELHFPPLEDDDDVKELEESFLQSEERFDSTCAIEEEPNMLVLTGEENELLGSSRSILKSEVEEFSESNLHTSNNEKEELSEAALSISIDEVEIEEVEEESILPILKEEIKGTGLPISTVELEEAVMSLLKQSEEYPSLPTFENQEDDGFSLPVSKDAAEEKLNLTLKDEAELEDAVLTIVEDKESILQELEDTEEKDLFQNVLKDNESALPILDDDEDSTLPIFENKESDLPVLEAMEESALPTLKDEVEEEESVLPAFNQSIEDKGSVLPSLYDIASKEEPTLTFNSNNADDEESALPVHSSLSVNESHDTTELTEDEQEEEMVRTVLESILEENEEPTESFNSLQSDEEESALPASAKNIDAIAQAEELTLPIMSKSISEVEESDEATIPIVLDLEAKTHIADDLDQSRELNEEFSLPIVFDSEIESQTENELNLSKNITEDFSLPIELDSQIMTKIDELVKEELTANILDESHVNDDTADLNLDSKDSVVGEINNYIEKPINGGSMAEEKVGNGDVKEEILSLDGLEEVNDAEPGHDFEFNTKSEPLHLFGSTLEKLDNEHEDKTGKLESNSVNLDDDKDGIKKLDSDTEDSERDDNINIKEESNHQALEMIADIILDKENQNSAKEGHTTQGLNDFKELEELDDGLETALPNFSQLTFGDSLLAGTSLASADFEEGSFSQGLLASQSLKFQPTEPYLAARESHQDDDKIDKGLENTIIHKYTLSAELEHSSTQDEKSLNTPDSIGENSDLELELEDSDLELDLTGEGSFDEQAKLVRDISTSSHDITSKRNSNPFVTESSPTSTTSKFNPFLSDNNNTAIVPPKSPHRSNPTSPTTKAFPIHKKSSSIMDKIAALEGTDNKHNRAKSSNATDSISKGKKAFSSAFAKFEKQ